MKKLFTVFLLITTIKANAQIKFEAGIGSSVDIGHYVISTNSLGFSKSNEKTVAFFNPGILLGVNFSNRVSVYTGFRYIREGDIYKEYEFSSGQGSPVIYENQTIRYLFLSIPVDARVNFLKRESRFSLGVEAQCDLMKYDAYVIKLSSPGLTVNGVPIPPRTVKYYSGKDSTGAESHSINDFAVDAGAGLFAGYKINRHISVTFSAYYKIDLSELWALPETQINARYRSFGSALNLLYRF